jgi:hypothetical protein
MQNDAAECIDSGTFLTRGILFRSCHRMAEIGPCDHVDESRLTGSATCLGASAASPATASKPSSYIASGHIRSREHLAITKSASGLPSCPTKHGRICTVVSLHRVRQRRLCKPRDRLERETRLRDTDRAAALRGSTATLTTDSFLFAWAPASCSGLSWSTKPLRSGCRGPTASDAIFGGLTCDQPTMSKWPPQFRCSYSCC